MNALQRKLLQRHRVHLVTKLKPELIYDFLVAKGVFTDDMIEEVKNSGTRRDQARQLVIDLQTRGTGAFPAFLESLQATGQHELLDLLQEELPIQDRPFTSVKPVEPQQGCQSVQQEIPTSRPIQCSDTDLVFPRTPTPRRLQDDMLIVEELKSLACKDHTDFDCCIVVILSHGSQAQHRQFPGAIFGVDGGQPVPVQHIVSYFDGSHSPTLREKPKLFFIQACGGDLKDTGFKTAEEVDSAPSIPYDTISLQTDATPCLAEDEPDAVSSLPTPSDILVSYSTYPGYVSWRHKKEGSWYMKALVHVISKYAHSDDLQTLLMRVTRSISENEEAKGKYKQIPGSFNFLRKHFYFFNKEKQ
ncbi:caspase-9 isoform X2 [Carcharodon carcharias]|uniref:caspase-9 isoform X2 n=1 Tax=Carcharodon carcharias TaxID=13397 RepID=UPI001B7E5CBB|nr:caspase-9 isoform X2 [Carcharodon carcharias]